MNISAWEEQQQQKKTNWSLKFNWHIGLTEKLPASKPV